MTAIIDKIIPVTILDSLNANEDGCDHDIRVKLNHVFPEGNTFI
jgi:hypothetical protein